MTIYDRVLDPSEILAIFQAGSAGKCKPSLLPVCDIQMSQAIYENGETVTAQVLRLANPSTVPGTVLPGIWLEAPGFSPIPFVNPLQMGAVVIPPEFDEDFGPLPLFAVDPTFPRGSYAFSCRMVDPVTLGLLTEDLNPFAIQ